MENNVWIISFLIKHGDRRYGPMEMEGYRTAVKAPYIKEALREAEKTITKLFNTFSDLTFITDIGLADEDAKDLIGKIEEDPLACEEWPE